MAEVRLSPNARRVLEARYLRRDAERRLIETPEELFARVARAIAEAELLLGTAERARRWEETFHELLTSRDFLPNSPTLMNAGTPLGQLSACFVLPVGDTMEEIFEAVKQMALVQRTGGGTGFSFSRLRPKGDVVASTGGEASGPVSFMKIFDSATEHIKQGGKRRGANMGVLRVDHPDILEFIAAKRDERALQNFNISVAVTDAFMEAARRGDEYELINPRTGQAVGRLNARGVFEEITRAAWETGDPGLLFLDAINRANPTPQLGMIEATNPCVTGDTWVLTAEGPRQVWELVGRSFVAVVNGREYKASGFWQTGARRVFRVETDRGFCARLTAEHPVLVEREHTQRRFEWVPVRELKPGDCVVLHNHRRYAWSGAGTFEEGWLLGQMISDEDSTSEEHLSSVCFRSELEVEMARLETLRVRTLLDWGRSDSVGQGPISKDAILRVAVCALDDLIEGELEPRTKTLWPELERGSSEFYRGFLQGLFDANGSVQETPERGISIRLIQSDGERLRLVQRMLARLGIIAAIFINRTSSELKSRPDGGDGQGVHQTRGRHELVIAQDNVVEFARRVGFSDPAKREALERALRSFRQRLQRERFTARVTAIVPDGVEPVYDCAVEGINAFDANGLVVHNCGEVPLLPWEACNLGSINLAHMLREREGRTEVDWEKLRATVRKAVRFLDDVIEVNRYPIPEIERMTRGNRKIGLGVMGFAEMLIRLGLSYDSDEAVELAERVMRAIAEEALATSIALAEERGVFPNWKGSVHEAQNRRVRNATLTAIAPTGTISIIADTSASIEPLFALAYRRTHVLGGETLYEVTPLFLEYLDRYGLKADDVLEAILTRGRLHDVAHVPEELKRLFVTALEIPPERHLQIQAAFQRAVDNSVSKTINMPEEATIEDVARAYWRAWELGLKGITIYRYGSKSAQVLELGLDEEAHHYDHASRCDPEECRV